MALIACPECGKEISDKSEACIHCGYPLINTKCNINGVIYDFKDELPIALLEKTDDYIPAIGKIRVKTSLSLTDACDLVDIIKQLKEIPTNFTPKYELEDREKLYGTSTTNTIKCPYCHSTNIQRIKYGFLDRFSFGYNTGTDIEKVGKQFHCNNCDANF